MGNWLNRPLTYRLDGEKRGKDMRCIFKVELAGEGETEAEAWQDAVEHFCLDPGMPCETEREREEEEGA